MSRAPLAFQGRNPDVLTCIANLSNDEVFTPPELANQMLDALERAWRQANGGLSIWEDPTLRFLDPFTKSGVFTREITKRLVAGLAYEMPDLNERVDHILTKQVYGIAITELTSLLARRSLYCSKLANGKHSIAKSFHSASGNIWYERMEHTWAGGRCRFCNAAEGEYGRSGDLETHAYAFIHTHDIKATIADIFGDSVKFDVIIGNPPYQLGSDGGTRDVPIYHHFVEQAKHLEPRYLCMVVPSRWMAGGLGLAEFRKAMLSDTRIRVLVDYPNAAEVFSSVGINGGACWFLWDSTYNGTCNVTTVRAGQAIGPTSRSLDEFDVFVRDDRALSILHKVLSRGEPSLARVLSARTAFGFVSNYAGYREAPNSGDIRFYATSPNGRFTAWVSRDEVTTNHGAIDGFKALIPEAGSGRERERNGVDLVLGPPWVADGPSVCTQSFLFVKTETREEAESVVSYYRTRFLRFLVSLRKITQHTKADTYLWVPQQTWDRVWTSEELYAKYGITDNEIAYIESLIRPMGTGDEPTD
ncbi:MAG: Eco57I restriction-modification methylase domain-containing protein [Actinomycetota bacterium]|nr:MAG: Eco57I restriction-modification methylase domain-containing protein [Actinomycetota bacterium]